jgi:CRP-like cAMP-binding protein
LVVIRTVVPSVLQILKHMEKIREYFEHSIQGKISEREWLIFMSKLIREEFPKNHIFLKTGQTEDFLSFVESGIVRYYIPNIENDLTLGFVFDGYFASAYDSLLTRTPSVYAGQTLVKTTLWRLSYTGLQDLYNETEIGNRIGRFASETLFLKKFKRELSLLNETAEQRYLNLFTEQPHLIQQIPLKYIASYIGVTPQALSRIRKRIY